MKLFEVILLLFLIVCSICVALMKNLLPSIIIFMSYSIVLSVLWVLIESPDLAVTEAAVGAGVTSILFFLALKRINALREKRDDQGQ